MMAKCSFGGLVPRPSSLGKEGEKGLVKKFTQHVGVHGLAPKHANMTYQQHANMTYQQDCCTCTASRACGLLVRLSWHKVLILSTVPRINVRCSRCGSVFAHAQFYLPSTLTDKFYQALLLLSILGKGSKWVKGQTRGGPGDIW